MASGTPTPGSERAHAVTSASPPPSEHPSSPPRLIGAGVDGKPGGLDAVALGALLARPAGSELMVIGVHREPLVPMALSRGVDWATVQDETWAQVNAARDAVAPQARTVVQADVLVWRGLRHVVRYEHRDLLVVGSAHDAEEGRVRLGRDAGELLEHLSCPLAIATSGLRDRSKTCFDRVGVGCNGGPESRAALRLAAAIASAAGAKLIVQGVVDDQVAGGLTTEELLPEGKAVVESELRSLFEGELAALAAEGMAARCEVCAGDPAQVLRELGNGLDLLVIGSAHAARPGRVELGRTGRDVLNAVRCPMLIVPRPAQPVR